MKETLSYSSLYNTLDELYNKLKEEKYSEHYLNALDDAKKSLLVLELLNISRPKTPK